MKDILKSDSIELMHCQTERMIADYFTKTLQGSLFREMRDIIMGLVEFPDEARIGLRVNMSIDSSGTYKVSVTEIRSRIKITNVGQIERPNI